MIPISTFLAMPSNVWNATKYNTCRLILCLFLGLVPGSLVSANSIQPVEWQKNVKVGVELKFGMPCGWTLKEEHLKKQENSVKDIKISPNWQFGSVAGYHFLFGDRNLAIGPEIGLFISTVRKCEASIYLPCIGGNAVFSMQERYLHIPLALKLASFDPETGVQDSGLALGYELCILRSSQPRQVGGKANPTIQSRLKEVEDIAKSLKTRGNIFLEGRVNFLKGCYLLGRLKLPITDLLGLKEAVDRDNNDKDARTIIHTVRLCSESFVELGIGVNIMKWFLSDY